MPYESDEEYDFSWLYPSLMYAASNSSRYSSSSSSDDEHIPTVGQIQKYEAENTPLRLVKPKTQLGFDANDMLKKLLPKEREIVDPEVAARYAELKEQEQLRHEKFLDKVMTENPVEITQQPTKMRQYDSRESSSSSDEGNSRAPRENDYEKSMEIRYQRKVERTANIYTVIHLRERILEYQMRMKLMKEMLSAAGGKSNQKPFNKSSLLSSMPTNCGVSSSHERFNFDLSSLDMPLDYTISSIREQLMNGSLSFFENSTLSSSSSSSSSDASTTDSSLFGASTSDSSSCDEKPVLPFYFPPLPFCFPPLPEMHSNHGASSSDDFDSDSLSSLSD